MGCLVHNKLLGGGGSLSFCSDNLLLLFGGLNMKKAGKDKNY